MTTVEFSISSSDGFTVYADLSRPDAMPPYPLVVVLRGAAGGARNDAGDYAHLAEHEALLPHGMAVCTVSHRGTPGHGPDFASMHDLGGPHIDDVIAVVRELAARDDIDADRINLLGASRGAFMAALCIGQYDLFAGAVLVNGYYRLRDWFEFQQEQFGDASPLAQVIRPSWQALWEEFPVDERSPDRYAEGIKCPVLMLHGAADPHVPPEQSILFHELLCTLGKHSELSLIPNMLHSYPEDGDPAWQGIWEKTALFLKTHSGQGRSQH